MPRPPKTDRNAVATDTLTLRLSPDDRALLDRLVAAKAAELETAGVELTAAAYVRGLIRQEGRRIGAAAAPSAPLAPIVERRATPRAAVVADEGKARAMLDEALAAGHKQSDIAAAAGLDSGHFSRWKTRKGTISDGKLVTLMKVLEKMKAS